MENVEFENQTETLDHQVILRKNWIFLKNKLEPEKVLDYLYQDGVFSEADRDTVLSKAPRWERCDALLDILKKKGQDAYKTFCVALDKEQNFIKEHLDKTSAELGCLDLQYESKLETSKYRMRQSKGFEEEIARLQEENNGKQSKIEENERRIALLRDTEDTLRTQMSSKDVLFVYLIQEYKLKLKEMEKAITDPVCWLHDADGNTDRILMCPLLVFDKMVVPHPINNNQTLDIHKAAPIQLHHITANTESLVDQSDLDISITSPTLPPRMTQAFPLQPFIPSQRAPLYWEAAPTVHLRERQVFAPPLLEIGMCDEKEVCWESGPCHQPHSWGISVELCSKHTLKYCTVIWTEGKRLGCLEGALDGTPGSRATLLYGIVLDVENSRLGLVDFSKAEVLGTFDVSSTESLCPMFKVGQFVDMTVKSGSHISLTKEKQGLILQALSCLSSSPT
ncbi:uncharacterized protein LOC124279010 [Haliotis rubra]|uniref:uncharacterized protein LOC124279010 n=1 Tax=Haliotis rubra TaxID=36100 RepID=UPI001EE5C4A1|nr:uncharacterized protein LOC124279010 [Haliotis rubra]